MNYVFFFYKRNKGFRMNIFAMTVEQIYHLSGEKGQMEQKRKIQ